MMTSFESEKKSGAKKALRERRIDHELAIGYLLSCSPADAFRIYRGELPKIGQGEALKATNAFNRYQIIFRIGVDAAVVWNQKSFMRECQQLASNMYWWNVLSQHDISFDPSRFSGNATQSYVRELLPQVISAVPRSLGLVLRFCQTYGIEAAEAVAAHIEALVLADRSTDAIRAAAAQIPLPRAVAVAGAPRPPSPPPVLPARRCNRSAPPAAVPVAGVEPR